MRYRFHKNPKQLKEKIKKLKIKPSKILRKALEDEVKKREVEELKEEINRLKPILEKISIVVQTARKKARNVVGSAATVILVRPKSAPNYAGTPADVKVGATVHIGGFITSAGVMNAFWIDVLVP